MKEFNCRDTGQNCDWKIQAESDDEILKKAAQHGQQEHGTKEFAEDIRQGVRSKIRDVKSSQIRGSSR
jgi:predicted small metal-binding protein